jgi:hypothetical protein
MNIAINQPLNGSVVSAGCAAATSTSRLALTRAWCRWKANFTISLLSKIQLQIHHDAPAIALQSSKQILPPDSERSVPLDNCAAATSASRLALARAWCRWKANFTILSLSKIQLQIRHDAPAIALQSSKQILPPDSEGSVPLDDCAAATSASRLALARAWCRWKANSTI